MYLASWPEDAYNPFLPTNMHSVVQQGTPYQHEPHQQSGLAINFQEVLSDLPITSLKNTYWNEHQEDCK